MTDPQTVRQVEPVSGFTLTGGEMLDHSDRAAARADHAGLELARRAVEAAEGPVLLIGPTASLLLEDLSPERAVSVLVRGTVDARSLQHSRDLHEGLSVHCGSLDRFDTSAHAVVVALDPLRMLVTPDSRPLSCRESLALMAGFTAESGVLVAEVSNSLGINDLQTAPSVLARDNFDHLAGEAAGGLFRHELAGALDHADLNLARCFAAVPSATHPVVLVRDDSLTDEELVQFAKTFTSAVAVDPGPGPRTLSDPTMLTERMFDARLAAELAPVWIVMWTHGDADDLQVPRAVAVEPEAAAGWRARVVVDDDDRHALGGLVASGVVERDLSRAYAGERGALVETMLTDACRVRDLTGVRHVVAAYGAWLMSLPAPEAIVATVDNTVCRTDGDSVTFGLFDPSWTVSVETTSEAALARNLWRFAQRLLRRSFAHPWVADAGADQITDSLCAMVGVDWTSTRESSVALEERLQASLGSAADNGFARLTTPGAQEMDAQDPRSASWRETVRANAELREELAVNRERIEWLERHLEWRDRQFAGLEKRMNTVTATTAYKVTDALGAPKRKAVKSARALVMDQLPPGFKDKAEKAVRRMLNDAT